ELHAVNNQLEFKIGELEGLNNDIANLFPSIDVATMFLDRALRIRRFTPAAKRLLHVIDTDLGRPFSDLARGFTDDTLLADAADVLDRLVPCERNVEALEGGVYLRRILPYRTEDDRIDGVVITFTDITRFKQQE